MKDITPKQSIKNRIEWLDSARGFAICMIVLAHITQYFPEAKDLNSFICGFHVSIFFVLSGCMAFVQREKREDFLRFVCKKAKTLLVPYAIFSTINFGLKAIVFFIQDKYTSTVFQKELVELFITGNGTVWFLTTLFLVEIIYQILKKYMKESSYVYTVFVVIFGSLPFLLNTYISPVLSVMKRVSMALAFYYVGYLLMRIISRTSISKGYELVTAIVLLIGGHFVWKNYGSQISYYEAIFSGGIASIATNMLLAIGFVLLFKGLPVIRFMSYLGRNSLIVMLIHPLLLMCYVYPIGFPGDTISYMQQRKYILVAFIILTVLQIPFIELINRYFPWMIGKEKKHD